MLINLEMNIFECICLLFAGIGVFLIGCKLLSENMERIANTGIKRLFGKISNNKLAGVGIGAATTALVQSSGVTTVMVVGFVNAGMITLYQATAFIMGANIGTTVVAQLASLQGFSVSSIAIIAAGIGMLITVFAGKKRDRLKIAGYIIAGLGLLFTGLWLMSTSMKFFAEGDTAKDILSAVSNPFLLLLIGIGFTALLNSSAAVTSIIISMAAAGLYIGGNPNGNYALFVILGSNIGSCITALMSSIGTSVNGKRASLIHLMFNVFGSILFFILLLCLPKFNEWTFAKLFSNPTNQIAMFHTFFNVTCTCLFLPFVKVFVKLSELIIRDKEEPYRSHLDKRFLASPGIAIGAVEQESMTILDESMKSLSQALNGFINKRQDEDEEIRSRNLKINEIGKNITNYLILISTVEKSLEHEKYISSLHSNIGDILRVAELSDNLMKYTAREIREDLKFSDIVKEQLGVMINTIQELADITKKIILNKQLVLVTAADEIEDRIDSMRKDLIAGHIERLNTGECKSESSSVFINLVGNLERAGDHVNYIAHSID